MNDSSTQIIEEADEEAMQQIVEEPRQNLPCQREEEGVQTPMINPEDEASVRRTEIQLFDTPQELPQGPGRFILVYFFLIFASDLIIQVVTSGFVIYAYAGPELDFATMTKFLLYCHVLKILMNLFYFFVFGRKLPEFKKSYLMDILLSISMIVVYATITNFLLGNFDASALKYFAIVTMMLTYLRLYISNKVNPPYVPGKHYYFYESVQMLVLSFKLEHPASEFSWNMSYAFYWILSMVLIVAAFALFVFIIILTIAACMGHEDTAHIPRNFFLGMIGIAFYVLCNCLFFVLAFLGFKFLMEEGKINPHQKTEGASRLLYNVAIAQVIVSTFNFILLTVIFILLRKKVIEYIYKNKSGEISMQSFSTNLRMNITQVSGSYFRTGAPDEENPQGQGSLEQCVICNDKETDVVINPCGHSCMCESCAKAYLQKKSMCPMCRSSIEKAYLICRNPDTGDIMARGVIIVNHRN